MTEIPDTATKSPVPSLVLGICGLIVGPALTGLAAKLLKNNAIWWGAIPMGAVGYGIGHLAGREIAKSKNANQDQKSEKGATQKDKPARVHTRLQHRHSDPAGNPGWQTQHDDLLLGSDEPRQSELEDLADSLRGKIEAQLAESEARLRAVQSNSESNLLKRHVSMSDYDKVKKFLSDRHLDPNAERVGPSALHHAVSENDHRMVQLLLPYCRDVNHICEGKNAIHLAIWEADADMCRLLMENGAALSDADRATGSPYLHVTILVDDPERLEAIVDCFENVDVTDAQGQTAAYFAARSGRIRHLKILLKHGSKLRKTDFSDEEWEHLLAEVQKIIPDTGA